VLDTFAADRFDNLKDNVPRPLGVDWPDPFMEFDERDRKEGVLWSPTVYPTGQTRAKEGVEQVTALVLDFDENITIPEVMRHLESLGLEYVLHTSYSHWVDKYDDKGNFVAPACDRFRVVLPLATPVSSAVHATLWAKWYEEWDGAFDEKCKDASRVYYLPAHPSSPPREPVSHHELGELLDAVEDIGDWEPKPAERLAPKYEGGLRWDDGVEAFYRARIVAVLVPFVPFSGGPGTPDGKSRTITWRSVTGLLLKQHYDREGLLRIIDEVCRRQGVEQDPDSDRRRSYTRCVDNQIKRLEKGDQVAGASSLPDDIVAQLRPLARWRKLFGSVLPIGSLGGSLVCYRDRRVEIPINQATNETRLGVALGPKWESAKHKLGAVWEDKKDDEGNVKRVFKRFDEKKARNQVAEILGQVCSEPVPEDEIADGVHLLGDEVAAISKAGTFVFSGSAWERLPAPIVAGHFSAPSGKVRSTPSVHTPDEIRAAYHELCELFGRWTFDSALVPYFLAATTLTVPLTPAIPGEPPWVWIQGQTNSGKSNLCTALFALSEHILELGNATPYTLMQEFGNKSAACVMDDVENNPRSLRQRDLIFDMYRVGYMTRGTINRSSKVERCRLLGPLIYSGISGPPQDQDLNRFWQVRTVQEPGHASPLAGQEELLARLRPVVSWGLACHAPRFLDEYETVRRGADEAGIPVRLARNVIPAAMMLKMLGEPWEALLQSYEAGACEELRESGPQEQRFLEYVLDVPLAVLDDHGSRRLTTVRRSIGTGSTAVDLPLLLGGWDPNGRRLFLNATALSAAMPARSEYADWEVRRITDILKAHPWYEDKDRRGNVRYSVLSPPRGQLGLEGVKGEPAPPAQAEPQQQEWY